MKLYYTFACLFQIDEFASKCASSRHAIVACPLAGARIAASWPKLNANESFPGSRRRCR